MSKTGEIVVVLAALVAIVAGIIYVDSHVTAFNFLGFKGIVTH